MVAERIVHPEAEYSAPSFGTALSPRAWRWTKQQYRQLVEDGYFQGRRIELIEGEIIEMSPMNAPHFTALGLVRVALEKAFGEGFIIPDQSPLELSEVSQPEPDLMVVRGEWRDYSQDLPTQAVLAIEISDTTLKYDQGRKLKLYARAGIFEYWILDLNARRLLVHREPDAENELYKSVQILSANDDIAPLEALQSKIKIIDLLP